ncbi:MAG: type I restriction enzyme HsdR N-terminal domain-containing protein [Thermomicrobiales bacterium]
MDEMQAVEVGTIEDDIVPTNRSPRTSRRPIPKWEEAVRNQIRTGLRKYSKPLGDMVERDANEGDTRLLVTDILCEMLGYDKFLDLTTEYQVKGEFADYGVRIEKQLSALIEVKRVATKLNARHLRQVQMYAVNEGVEWIILTNGVVWQVYHLTGGLPIVVDLVTSIDILDNSPTAQKIDHLFLLSRESMKRHQIDDLWQERRATAPSSLASVILTNSVITAIRRELKRATGHGIDDGELRTLIRETVLKDDCFSK